MERRRGSPHRCTPLVLLLLAAVSLGHASAAEDAVLQLNSDNFDQALYHHPALFVAFHAPWCGHCRQLQPDFFEAARALEGRMAFGWIDATLEPELSEKYGVRGYPTIKLLRADSAEDYSGGRQAADIVRWMEERISPAVAFFGSEEETEGLESVLETRSPSKTIFHGSGGEGFQKVFEEVSQRIRMDGAWAMRRQTFARSDKGDKLEVFRGVAERLLFDGDLSSAKALEAFMRAEELPLFGQVDDDNFQAYLSIASRGIVWLCLGPEDLDKETRRLHQGLGIAASPYRGEIPFIWLDTVEYAEHVRDDLRCTTFPMVVVQLGDMRSEEEEHTIVKFKTSLPSDFAPEAVGKFLEECIAGTVEPVDPLDEEDEQFENADFDTNLDDDPDFDTDLNNDDIEL